MASLVKPPMQCHNNLQFPDSRPRACSHRSLFVRRTPTRPRAKGQEPHFTQRLVRSVRCGSRVRQRTLRNLGRHVALQRGGWPALAPPRHDRDTSLPARRRPVRPAAHRHPARPDQHVLRGTGSRWPAAAIPGRSATTVRRSRWAWCWTPAASCAAPGSWSATSPRAARCRPCRRPWTRRPRRPSCSTGAATRRRWPGSGSRWRAAGRPIPGSTACAPTASAGTPSGCGAPA